MSEYGRYSAIELNKNKPLVLIQKSQKQRILLLQSIYSQCPLKYLEPLEKQRHYASSQHPKVKRIGETNGD